MNRTRSFFKSLTIPALLFGALLLALLSLTTLTVSAQSKQYFWERFDVDVQVLENGDLFVTEHQTLYFSGEPFTFGYRTVPTGRWGNNDGISDVSVREGDIIYAPDGSGASHTVSVSNSRTETEIYWYFPAATGAQDYTLSYRVHSAVRTEPSGDQVFWNALPADLGARVQESTITITLPEGIEAAATTALVDGREGNGIETSVSENGRQVTFQLTRPRLSGDDVEVGVRFPSGQLAISTPAWQQAEQRADAFNIFLLVFSLLIAAGGPLAAIVLWYLVGRDPQVGPVPQYLAEPPDDTPPAVVGTLIDETAHIHDIMSTLIDLARRGYLKMAETGPRGDYNFERTDKPIDDLRPYEAKMIRGIFGSRQSRDLDDLRYKFANNLPGIRKELYRELEAQGFVRRSPESVRNSFGCLAFGALGLAFLSFFALGSIFGEQVSLAICPALALGLTGVVWFVVSRYMPAKTREGAEAAARWLAFKNYLRDIEKQTKLEEATDIFEKYLAYAVAFGLERSWIRKFSSVPSAPIPPWYIPYPAYGHGPGRTTSGGSRQTRGGTTGGAPSPAGGRPSLEGMSGGLTGGLAAMSGGLTRMLTNTQTVLQSTRSSSSSGGGGFSGGFSGGSSGGGSGGFG
ncbi:MAG TPA: DUF2207 domain-containing protein [Candidatus Sulfomarinibacteraceae bacterium]|nr:DUF2207 domain-containing protein [Candidatus Sulfomarinibacteraceae bacterium]